MCTAASTVVVLPGIILQQLPLYSFITMMRHECLAEPRERCGCCWYMDGYSCWVTLDYSATAVVPSI